MRSRRSVVLLCLAVLVIVLFLPGSPWAGSIRHAIKKTRIKAEMRLARWRGQEPRLMSIAGRVDEPGAQIQALDSRSGWATFADGDGRFVLPDVMWYPSAVYELIISSDDSRGRLATLPAPRTFPDGGLFDAGDVKANQDSEVQIDSLNGVTSITRETFDAENRGYYKDLFDKLTAGKESDEDKIAAVCEYVAGKLNYQVSQPESGSPRVVLEQGSEFCGYLSSAMETLLAAANYKTRSVNGIDDRHPPGTHVVVEVFYNGNWHLYDPTFGVKFHNRDGKIASYREVRLDPSIITEDLFVKFDAPFRQNLMEMLPGIYRTGYHHFYYFKNN